MKKIISSGKFWASLFAIIAVISPKVGKDLVGVSDQFSYVAAGIFTIIATITATFSEKPGGKNV